jgi:PKD repeat protein
MLSMPALRAALALKMTLVLGVLVLLAAATASAEPGFEYGEAVRFGGFDSSAYDHGQFGGPLTPGRFLDPTGFAVDPQDNTVYVVDRTSSPKLNPTDWRIQQFGPEGVLLGTTTFTLPNEPSKGPGQPPDASAIEGLAVDHRAGRLYALVVGSPPPSSPYQTLTVAQELLAWSTTPVAGGLVAASVAGGGAELPPDEVGSPIAGSPGTVGGVVSREQQLLSGPTPLYGPQGIAVDPLEAAGVENPVAIEASDVNAGVGKGKPIIGDTVVRQVATQGAGTGDLLASWSSASVAGVLGASWGPHGISTSPDGTLTALLDAEGTAATDVYAVKLKADLSEASALNSQANVPPLGDFDQAPMYMNESPFLPLAGTAVSNLRGAGPQVVHLSAPTSDSAGGPYAAVIFTDRPGDNQVGATAPEASEYWTSGENAAEEFEANIGVRLLEPEVGTGEAISNLQGSTIVNTLGNGARGGPCNIGAPEAALAAGADGTLWILDRGPNTEVAGARGQGREVIELAPGALQKPCPQPEGTFTMSAVEQGKPPLVVPGGGELTVSAGTQVTFEVSSSSIHRHGGKPFAYEWDLDGDPTNGPAGDGFEKVYQMQPPKFYYPPSHITYMYTRPGKYEVRMRMRTDYGAYTPKQSGTVTVTQALTHPEALFTATPSGGQQVTFNATGSTPGVGRIVDYRWNWGDGGEEDEDPQTPVVAHTYAAPGSYQVTLKVTNSSYQSVTSAPQTVTVTVPPSLVHPAASLLTTGPLYDIPPPFAPYPIPPGPVSRSPTRLSPHARFAGGVLSVTFACPKAKKLCAGTVSIETAAAIAAAAKAGKGKGKGKGKPSRLLLGHAAFSLAGGHSKTVKVRLSAQGMALLRSRKHLKVLVIVAAHDSLGDPGTATLGLTLNAPATHRKHGKH